jgi:hypothetical protein
MEAILLGRDMQRVERLNLALSAGAAAAGFALVSPHFALSLAAGAVFETVNYHHLIRSTRAMFEGTAGVGAFRFAFALLFVAGAIGLGAHPVGLLIGVSLIMPIMVIEAWRNRPAIVADAPVLSPDDPSWDRWNPWLAHERDDDDEEGYE